MNRDEQEMTLWVSVYEHWFPCHGYEPEECGNIADAAVAEFRKRYPPQPTACEVVWYDTPPFSKDRKDYYCWVEGFDVPQAVYWSVQYSEWRRCEVACQPQPLAGRRVCPIVKPPEPTT